MQIYDWAKKWEVSIEAIEDLRKTLGCVEDTPEKKETKSEFAVLCSVRLEASKKNIYLWRNNVGATYTRDNNFIRYGLANDSVALNKRIKSADLIGIRPILITQEHVGKTLGQFVSREIKKFGWKYSATEREVAQENWAALILSMGGDACFATAEGTL